MVLDHRINIQECDLQFMQKVQTKQNWKQARPQIAGVTCISLQRILVTPANVL